MNATPTPFVPTLKDLMYVAVFEDMKETGEFVKVKCEDVRNNKIR